MTKFDPGSKPRVAIAAALSEKSGRENRQRTTLAHEYGHVELHTYLYDLHPLSRPLLDRRHEPTAIYCKRTTILSAAKSDWMEWQAGYACGAVLMPRTYVQQVVGEYKEAWVAEADRPQGPWVVRGEAQVPGGGYFACFHIDAGANGGTLACSGVGVTDALTRIGYTLD